MRSSGWRGWLLAGCALLHACVRVPRCPALSPQLCPHPPLGVRAVTIALAIQSFGGAAGKAAYEQQAVVVLACKGAVIFFTIVLGAATSRLVNRLLAGDSNALASHGTLGALPSIAPGGVR